MEMMINSDADISVIPIDVVHELHLQSPQIPMIVGQVAGSMPATYTTIRASVKNKVFNMPVIGVRWFDMPLLGRAGFFDNFAINFNQSGFTVTPT